MHGVQHPRMTMMFEKRNEKQNQTLKELRPKDLEHAPDWHVRSLYWASVPIHVKKRHRLHDKLNEEEAVVSKSNLIDRVLEYRDRKQALLFCVDSMLTLSKPETQRQLSRMGRMLWEIRIELGILVPRCEANVKVPNRWTKCVETQPTDSKWNVYRRSSEMPSHKKVVAKTCQSDETKLY